ncbi:MAG TPA: type II toxin-antitoxin system VapC family toxin [Allosphingosinicella sp.]|jgi:predicted nucleic acid-binding protein
MIVVVDASLAAKWMLWEADSRTALRFLFRKEHELCAPDLLFTEVAAAIVKRANMKKEIAADALEALRKWTIAWGEHAVRPHRVTQRRLYEAGKLAMTLGHPLKDCVYLGLAMEFQCALATCDAKFVAKARTVHSDVKLLHEFELADEGIFKPEA